MHEYVRLLCSAAEEFADETALVDREGTRATDYRRFGELMHKTAAWIYDRHLSERSFIPVCFESSMEFAACVCGVWLSGHAAVPMGKSFPPERIKYISRNCDAPFIINDDVLDEIEKAEPKPVSVYPDSKDEDVALLLYTSGSTGMPKGILHTFKGLYANQQMGNRATYSTGQKWAMGAPFYFVASIAIYKVLTCGGCVHLMDEATMRDVGKLEDYYEKNGITIGFISPSVLSNFHSRSETLKVVMTGSERLTGQCSRDGYKLFNNYGMSETMGTVCSFLVDQPYETTPVGIPPEGSEWALLDDNMNPVPDGEEGEYCTKGPYTIGYFKDEEATKKLFRGGWLHTGDILKKLPDGNLVYINRKDWMVKINGQRVEPGEIENALRVVPGVDKAVVKAIKGQEDKIFLCAYYTGEELEDAFLSEKLGEKLASYMIPAFYMHLDEFPLNQNGKIDRKNLPEPDVMSKRSEYVPPENDTQAMLCRAFEAALATEQIGIDDDFFAMGGDSIRVMRLASECPELDLTSKLIYAAKTPRKIAEECLKRGNVKERVKKAEYPLSGSQLGIYIESMSRDGEAAYNNPILLKISDSIDMDKLRTACEAVVAAHPFIKLKLKADENGDPIQVRNDDEAYSQTVEKLKEDEFKSLIPSLMQPFRLHNDRLFRIRLFETEKGKYLFTDLHHIIFDGASMLVMVKDIERAYNGGTLETETYSGFEVAEDEAERKETDYEKAREWYLSTFSGIEVDSLPIPDRNEKTTSFGLATADLAVEASEVEALCRKYGVTENIYATAAFGICAGLYAGTNEALFSTIYNGRDSLRTAKTIAMLVKTLPVYARFEKDQAVRDYLEKAKEQMLSCMSNDIYPFSELAAETGISSNLLFVYQGDVLNVGGFAGEPVEQIPVMTNATGEQLALQMYKQDGLYNIRVEYRSDLYSEQFINILINSYKTVLQKLLTAETVGEVSIAGYEELEQLKEWNKTEKAYDRSETVVSLFKKAAERYADRTAVIYEDKKLTYVELDRLSDKIAAHIESEGLKNGDVVSILIPRGTFQAAASLGALKAGCAYQPLDSTYPTERLNFMVEDASASLLITDNNLSGLITGYGGKRSMIEDAEGLPDKAPANTCAPEDGFILLYTSGSTGVPKGVKLTHGNLTCFIDWYRSFYNLTENDTVGQYASYGFDACMMDMYPALCTGAAVCIVPEEIRLDLERMNEYFIMNKVTLAFMTTQVGRQFAVDMKNPYLRAVSVGGEKLASMEPPKGLGFYNLYGPTEGTIISTAYKITKREDNIPIGYPLDNVKCYVVDPFGHQLPPGAIGELIIAGPHVGAGYLNRPEKTAEVFIENPFEGGDFAAAYKTGDIVRYRTDGAIEFIGRRDGQVKIHGFRIELSEVEAVIRDYEGVRDVAVVARDLGADGKAVAAYFVSDAKIDPADIAAFILDRKPPYMVPASIMQIDAIPLNQNGKVNKKALPEPEIMTVGEEDDTHIDNILETELRKIIGEALNMEKPPLNVPLSNLGFSSLSMIRLSTKLVKRFGADIPVKEMKDISIAGIENIILNTWMNGGGRSSTDELAEEKWDAAGLSSAQMGVYVECMKKPESTVYNIPVLMNFDKDMAPGRLVQAVGRVLAAHPSLFVHFDIRDNQVMAIRDEMVIPEILVKEVSENKLDEIKGSFVIPFNLTRGPLFRMAVVKTEERVCLFADFHHLVFDGFSMNLFMKGLSEALRNENSELEKEGASYFSFVRSQNEAIRGEGAKRYDEYFAGLLADFDSATELPKDVSHETGEGTKHTISMKVDEKLIAKACDNTGVGEPAFFLAALDYTLARLSASDSIYISTISSGRSDVRYADTFGMFVNTIPLAAKLGNGSVNDFINEVSAGLEEALAHENYPFAEVAAKWGYSVNVMYEYQRGIVEKMDMPSLKSVEGLESTKAKFGITVRIVDTADGPAIELDYSDASYTEKTAKAFIESFAIVLKKFAADGRAALRRVDLLDDERRKLISGFHERDYTPQIPAGTLFQSGVEHFAEIDPDRQAILAADGDYTYRELDENANRIANALIKRGIKERDRVVLLLPRTARVLFAIYGVLKTGAAYIPCDPNYPVERIKHIIDDSDAGLIITTADRLEKFKDRPAVDVEMLLMEENITRPEIKITEENLAYLIYTSGSTGKPKGVMLRHKGIVNYVTDTPESILVHSMVENGHVITAVTTLSFDLSLKEWGLPLYNGMTVSFAADNEINDADRLAARMKATSTDMFNVTPSRLMTLMESEAFTEALNKCKVLVCGGEKYPEALLRTLKGVEGRILINTYGPTEITVSSNGQILNDQPSVNIGRPLPGVKEYIVDSDGNEVPPGVVGELLIGGIGVGAGYNGLPEMTEKSFVDYNGERVYRSGDFARWTDEGFVEILGRKDNQIKLRGLRIELGEVESVLAAVEGMDRTAVKIEKINGIEHLCAWFTADHEVDIAELKKQLGRTLTNYMVPTAYMQLKEMPITPNGKLDLKNLPVPELFRAGNKEAASTPAEKIFSEIFSSILHVDDIGATENFFDLGGTSLLVTNVVIEAGRRGLAIAFGDVFDNPTPRALAALASGADAIEADDTDREITDYDYKAIDEMLVKNTVESFKTGECHKLGNVLLTGAGGYLGIHILRELIEHPEKVDKIYCMIRSQEGNPSEKRLSSLYFYYFDTNLIGLMGDKLFVIDADVTDRDSISALEDKGIDTVINCAAVVKHFSSGTIIEDVNVGGAVNLVDFCLKTGARMIQTSTMSVIGQAYADDVDADYVPTEKTLYFKQLLDNKYIHSKFLSERAVLEAVATKGLKGKVMRFGNLAARDTDGEFQINFETNSAVGRLKAFVNLGCAAYDQLEGVMEFSPIDAVAEAVVLLAGTPDDCTLFHVCNNRSVFMESVFSELNNIGYTIDYVEREEFAKAFAEAQSDPEKASTLTSLMAYMQLPGGRRKKNFGKKCDQTMQILYRLGFSWPETTRGYIDRLVAALAGFGFFDL